MRIFQEKIIPPDNLLVVKKETFKYNDFPLHSHPEFELILIMESAGQRIVGDSITEYYGMDLCLFGADLPHTFYTQEAVTQVVVQFHASFLGPGFFDKKPFQKIKQLLDRAARGVCFTGLTRERLADRIAGLPDQPPAEAVIEMLQVLHRLSVSEDFFLLSSPGFSHRAPVDESPRMSQVYQYILQNFKADLTLDDVAAVACLSPSAFCRYFKKFTRKTLSGFLTDLRIGHACRLLQEGRLGIAQVSTEAGFNNLSYFNRKFKAVKGETPMEYQRHFTFGKQL
ncbi:MAG TPA: AraC family transcriptional regulator [Dinghuibacter sp.]|uniref:helix-turn-helix transcriptional regulator n=1 Tax=Dinghuibacter sp. TaxID=2024697 RepID=UPI002C93F86A|nr:AraC family transcriptional regulator [Dinghuibacter sp.]HTJ11312.1 AraC family transcriptional regulator [Dinghuibacter sp.]